MNRQIATAATARHALPLDLRGAETMTKQRAEVPAPFLFLAIASGLCSLLFSATGCGAPNTSPKPDSGTAAPVKPARECSVFEEGKPRACTCSDGTVGTQACLAGKYQPCNCYVPPPSPEPLCKAGFYSGEFTGLYRPGVFGLGIFEGPFEYVVQGRGAGDYPALSFTLLEKTDGDSELATYTVKNGCMVGSASVDHTNSPFIGRFNGELDCATGAFKGTITGQYDLVGLNLLKYEFSGTATGQFQLPQARLTNGLWNVAEPSALLGQPAGGGGGTWSAIWESATPPAGKDPCSSAFSADGGTVDGSTADAGR